EQEAELSRRKEEEEQHREAALENQRAEELARRKEQERRQAELTRQRRIANLLTEAGDDIKALRLFSPKGNDALEKYREVLRLEPGNTQAKRGLEAIVGRYIAMAESTVGMHQYSKAEEYLAMAEGILPRGTGIKRALQKLEKARLAY
ncbi:MAG: DUF1682 domain-containing protein, partial [Deltaproteobacteria bacterium]|nr:DUF1682 domain-containing protein [Deltaproteobacteria bacterium]